MGQLLFECPRSAGEMMGFSHKDPYHREIFCYEAVKS